MKAAASYRINEIFFSLQGEGARAGTANVFVRFSRCNLKCAMEPSAISPGGFKCDTDFEAGRQMDVTEILNEALALVHNATPLPGLNLTAKSIGVIFTGGEPALQLDVPLLYAFRHAGFLTAIETNGTINLGTLENWLDWTCVSPKVPEDRLKQLRADEVKYVVTADSPIPETRVEASFHLLSPAFSPDGTLPKENLAHAIALVQANPTWRLSYQAHKIWGVR